jgi:hypothetical protein
MAVSMFSWVRQPIQEMLSVLLSDDNFREKVTYKRYTGQSFDASAGHTVNTYDDTVLYAVRMQHNQRSVNVSTSMVEVGDVLFVFDGPTFPEDSSLKDLIEDAEGNLLGIKGIDPAFDLAVFVTVASSS